MCISNAFSNYISKFKLWSKSITRNLKYNMENGKDSTYKIEVDKTLSNFKMNILGIWKYKNIFELEKFWPNEHFIAQ